MENKLKLSLFDRNFFVRNIALFFLVAVFLITRLILISDVPGSVYWDEASIGYNAYSILTTGADEWGEYLPLHFRAFGEFKLPVYVYSVVPFVWGLGLNAYSVRLPAVIYSLGSMILVYKLGKKLAEDWRAGIFTAFFFLISPWYFIFSRTGYEASAGVFFFLSGLYFIFKEKSVINVFLVSIFFILSFYSYNSFRIVIPLFVFGVLIYLHNFFLKNRGYLLAVFLSLLIFFAALLPVYKLFSLDAGSTRLIQVADLSVAGFTSGYIKHFFPSFLFMGDENPRSQIPGMWQVYPVQILLIFVGLSAFLIKKERRYGLSIFLLLISLVPSALTNEAPHALRSVLASVPISFLSAFGLMELYKYDKLGKGIITLSIFSAFVFFGVYAHSYYSGYWRDNSQDWQYGYASVFRDYSEDINGASRVIVSDRYAQPYVFALFYMKHNVEDFRNTVSYNEPSNWGFSTVSGFDKFLFKEIEKDDFKAGNSLIFVSNESVPEGFLPIGKILFLNGTKAFDVYSI